MKTSIVIDNSPPITYLEKFWFSSYGSKCCWPIKLQDSLNCNVSRKVNGEVYFWFGEKHRNSLQVDLLFWVFVARHAQSTQNNKFAISLQYLKENWKNEVDFLLADKHQNLFELVLSF